MKKIVFAAMLFGALSTMASAAEPAAPAPKNDPNDTGKLTFLEVLNIGQALQQMGTHYDGRGQQVVVPFRFDGTTLMTFAVNIKAVEDARKTYQDAYAKFEAQELGDVKDKTPEEIQQKKAAIANSPAATRMANKPAGILLARIKAAELCMSQPPAPPCTVKNDMPPAMLATILPIVDR